MTCEELAFLFGKQIDGGELTVETLWKGVDSQFTHVHKHPWCSDHGFHDVAFKTFQHPTAKAKNFPATFKS